MDEKGRLRWVVVLTAVGSFMAALDTLVVASALSTIRQDLGASLTDLEWTVNAYNLSFAVLLVPAAVLGDRLGRARTYAAGLVLFALASAGCALSGSVGALVAMRVVQGAGAAVVMTLGLALLTSAFPPEKRGAALGLFSAVTGIAVAMGPLVGGAVVDGLAWQWIFWLNVPVGLLAAPLALRLIPEARVPDSRLDVPGVALLAAGVLGLVWGVVRGEAAGWDQRRGARRLRGRPPDARGVRRCGSAGRRTRCCRPVCCACAASPRATWRSHSPSPRCSRRCSSTASSCRWSWPSHHWGRASGSWRGPGPSWCSRRRPVPWPTGSVNGPCSRPGS